MSVSDQTPSSPYLITLGNEKGGSGKSTTAMHITASLMHAGRKVGVMDLDGRQATLSRYVENRQKYAEDNNLLDVLPMPVSASIRRSELGDRGQADADEKARFEDAYGRMYEAGCEVIVIDCPGSDTFLARLAHTAANTLVTPLNDSFIDLDLLARVNPDTYDVLGPSLYAEMVWKARQRRMSADGHSIDWVVIRNRVGTLHAKNKKRVQDVLDKLSKRIGMRFIPGLSERVIYRELFLKGLTLMDLKLVSGMDRKGLTISQVTARTELRTLMQGLNLPKYIWE